LHRHKVGGKKHNKAQTAAIYRKNKLVAKNQLSVADQLPRPPPSATILPKYTTGFLPARIHLAHSFTHSLRSFWLLHPLSPSISLSLCLTGIW